MAHKLSLEELDEIERRLSSALNPVTPRSEFVKNLRHRILDPAPEIMQARNWYVDLWFALGVFSLLVLLIGSIIAWRYYKKRNNAKL